MIDFSDCPVMPEHFSGTERKIGVRVDGVPYLLKFQSHDNFGGHRFNHVSEYLGSSIFEMLGIDSQMTLLGRYKGDNVVACRIFHGPGIQFVPFDDVGDSTLDTTGQRAQYSYEGIMDLLRMNQKLTNVEETIDTFWNIYIVDGLLGNFDRHGSNWGFLKENNRYRLAPVFDNGSCLFPKMTDEDEMLKIIQSAELTDERVYKFPSSQIKYDGSRSSYFEVISSRRFEECNRALLRIYPRIKLSAINRLIDKVEGISDIHKRFYKHIIGARYSKILSFTYEELVS